MNNITTNVLPGLGDLLGTSATRKEIEELNKNHFYHGDVTNMLPSTVHNIYQNFHDTLVAPIQESRQIFTGLVDMSDVNRYRVINTLQDMSTLPACMYDACMSHPRVIQLYTEGRISGYPTTSHISLEIYSKYINGLLIEEIGHDEYNAIDSLYGMIDYILNQTDLDPTNIYMRRG